MRRRLLLLLLLCWSVPLLAADDEHARYLEPDYSEPKVVYDFYLDDPAKMPTALYWLRALINPLAEPPYSLAPEMMSIKVVIHGTEIVTVAKKNYQKYRDVVERMRYYAALGVEFKVCSLAAADYGYRADELYAFIDLVPSAFTELVHWQQQGYALLTPQVYLRSHAIEDIR